MAQRKTSYTNADLKTSGGPTTEYGPWKTKQKDPYEDMLAEPMSVEDIMADSKQRRATAGQESDESLQAWASSQKMSPEMEAALVRTNSRGVRGVVGDSRAAGFDVQNERAHQQAQADSSQSAVWEKALTYGLAPAAATVGTPFAVGGAGLAAGALGVKSAVDFARKPGWGTGIGALLSAIPAVSAMRGAGTAAKVMSPGKAAWNAERSAAWTPEQAGPAYRPLTRARMPPREPSPPPAPRTPQNTGTAWAPGTMPKPWGTFGGKSSPPLASVPRSAQEDMLSRLGSQFDNEIALNSPSVYRSEGLPRQSMSSLVDDVPEFTQVDTPPVGGYETYQGVGAANSTDDVVGGLAEAARKASTSRPAPAGPSVTRVPRGTQGDEYASVRETGGGFDPRNTKLDPIEAGSADEFWDDIMGIEFDEPLSIKNLTSNSHGGPGQFNSRSYPASHSGGDAGYAAKVAKARAFRSRNK